MISAVDHHEKWIRRWKSLTLWLCGYRCCRAASAKRFAAIRDKRTQLIKIRLEERKKDRLATKAQRIALRKQLKSKNKTSDPEDNDELDSEEEEKLEDQERRRMIREFEKEDENDDMFDSDDSEEDEFIDVNENEYSDEEDEVGEENSKVVKAELDELAKQAAATVLSITKNRLLESQNSRLNLEFGDEDHRPSSSSSSPGKQRRYRGSLSDGNGGVNGFGEFTGFAK